MKWWDYRRTVSSAQSGGYAKNLIGQTNSIQANKDAHEWLQIDLSNSSGRALMCNLLKVMDQNALRWNLKPKSLSNECILHLHDWPSLPRRSCVILLVETILNNLHDIREAWLSTNEQRFRSGDDCDGFVCERKHDAWKFSNEASDTSIERYIYFCTQ